VGTKQLAALWVVACATTARTQQVEITGGTGAYRGAKGNYKFTGTAPSGSTTVTGHSTGSISY
jgi:hypothetical protein